MKTRLDPQPLTITIEGLPGVGKTIVAEWLAKELGGLGFDNVTIFDDRNSSEIDAQKSKLVSKIGKGRRVEIKTARTF